MPAGKPVRQAIAGFRQPRLNNTKQHNTMTQRELLTQFKTDPFGKGLSSTMRFMDGVLMRKVMSGGSVVGWTPIAVVDDALLIWPSATDEFFSTRATNNGIRSLWYDVESELSTGRVKAEWKFLSRQRIVLLEPNRRVFPSRRDVVASLLRAAIMYGCPYSDNPAEAQHLKLWWDIVWEYTLTKAAARMVKATTTRDVTIQRMASSDHLSTINSLVQRMDNYTRGLSSEDPSTLIEKLVEYTGKLDSAAKELQTNVNNARDEARLLYTPFCDTPDTDPTKPISASFRNSLNHSWMRPLSLQSEDLVESWGPLTKFMRRCGLVVPKPFGFEFNRENLKTLAALLPTAEASMRDPIRTIHHILNPEPQTPNPLQDTCNGSLLG